MKTVLLILATLFCTAIAAQGYVAQNTDFSLTYKGYVATGYTLQFQNRDSCPITVEYQRAPNGDRDTVTLAAGATLSVVYPSASYNASDNIRARLLSSCSSGGGGWISVSLATALAIEPRIIQKPPSPAATRHVAYIFAANGAYLGHSQEITLQEAAALIAHYPPGLYFLHWGVVVLKLCHTE